jgi:hypothetical protein
MLWDLTFGSSLSQGNTLIGRVFKALLLVVLDNLISSSTCSTAIATVVIAAVFEAILKKWLIKKKVM